MSDKSSFGASQRPAGRWAADAGFSYLYPAGLADALTRITTKAPTATKAWQATAVLAVILAATDGINTNRAGITPTDLAARSRVSNEQSLSDAVDLLVSIDAIRVLYPRTRSGAVVYVVNPYLLWRGFSKEVRDAARHTWDTT